MWLSLKNIGKVGKAEIEIAGITVIAGENDTGKSTVGRALFAVFNGLYDYGRKIREYRVRSVESLLDTVYGTAFPDAYPDTNEIAENIVADIDNYRDISADMLVELFAMHEQELDYLDNAELTSMVDEIVPRLRDALNVSDQEALRSILEDSIETEFGGQASNIFSTDIGEIALRIKDKTTRVALSGKQLIELSTPIPLRTEVICLDDPFIIDEPRRSYYRYPGDYSVGHRDHLRRKLNRRRDTNVIDKIVAGDRFENIYARITSVCGGEIVMNRRYELGYRLDGAEKSLDVRNLSTGLKTFVILKMLLINGSLEYNGTIVLDEPEIHLHPEWQLFFAELIVLLQKEFNMHILLNTHSPYFLRAIQVYSARHGRSDVCRYYLSDVKDGIARIENVTGEIDKIYEKLAKPLQQLEDERWQDV